MTERADNVSWPATTPLPLPPPPECQLFQTTLYVSVMLIICLPGLIGNAISMVVLGRDSRAAPVAAFLLRSLAVADSAFLLVWTVQYPIRWLVQRFGTSSIQTSFGWICLRVYTFPVLYIGQTLTIWLMLVIAVNRFLLIRSSPRLDVAPYRSSPIAPSRLMTYRCVVATVTVGAIIYNLPRFFEIAIVNGSISVSGSSSSSTSTSTSSLTATGFKWARTSLGQDSVYRKVYVDYMYYAFTFIVPLAVLITVNTYVVVVYRAALSRHRQHVTASAAERSDTGRSSRGGAMIPVSIPQTATAVIGCCGCGTGAAAAAAAAEGGPQAQLLMRHETLLSGSGCTCAARSGSLRHVVICDLSTTSSGCCTGVDWIANACGVGNGSQFQHDDGDMVIGSGGESGERRGVDGDCTGTDADDMRPQSYAVDNSSQSAAETADHQNNASPEVALHLDAIEAGRAGSRGCGVNRIRRSIDTAEREVTVAMAAVILVFVICQCPARAVQFAWRWQYDDCRTSASFYLIHISNVLELLNSAVNFFVYCALYRRFRSRLCELASSCRLPSIARCRGLKKYRCDRDSAKGADKRRATSGKVRRRRRGRLPTPTATTEGLELREYAGSEMQAGKFDNSIAVVDTSAASAFRRHLEPDEVQVVREAAEPRLTTQAEWNVSVV
jgi:hypothetical protein